MGSHDDIPSVNSALQRMFQSMIRRSAEPVIVRPGAKRGQPTPSEEDTSPRKIGIACVSGLTLPAPDEFATLTAGGTVKGLGLQSAKMAAVRGKSGRSLKGLDYRDFRPSKRGKEEPSFRGLVYSAATAAERANAQNSLLAQVQLAARHPSRPRLIVANELAFPSCVDTGVDPAFQASLATIARTERVVIVAGSYHDARGTWFNLSPIFHPFAKEPLLHPKVNSAAKVAEQVRMPYARRIQYFDILGLRFVPLICLDAFDAGLIASLARALLSSHGTWTLDVVVVPALMGNKVNVMQQLCQDVGYVTEAPVLMVDSSGPELGHRLYWDRKEVVPLDRDKVNQITWYEWDLDERRRVQGLELRRRASDPAWRILHSDAIVESYPLVESSESSRSARHP